MGKIKQRKLPKTKLTWVHFAKFWSARGLGPEAATRILAEHWLEKGWNDGLEFQMFKDPILHKEGQEFVEYVHARMKEWRLGFQNTCKKLYTTNDSITFHTLVFLCIPNAVDLSKGKILVSQATFVKWCGWWRSYFFDKDFIDEFNKLERNMIKAGTAKKAKKKKVKKK
jgi:hypothetical protein|tara:strand:+ start:482 stop:988 length:507 start_codon:yes stop_codon:yes gene_type:complete